MTITGKKNKVASKFDETDLILIRLEKFFKRMRSKVVPSNHNLKKTDRLKMRERYPEYKETAEFPPQEKLIDVNAMYKTRFDSELLAKFKSFFAFFANIFKKNEKKDD